MGTETNLSNFYKVYLVEVGGGDREKVLSGFVDKARIKVEENSMYAYEEFQGGVKRTPVDILEVTLTVKLKCGPDGTYFTIENFDEDE